MVCCAANGRRNRAGLRLFQRHSPAVRDHHTRARGLLMPILIASRYGERMALGRYGRRAPLFAPAGPDPLIQWRRRFPSRNASWAVRRPACSWWCWLVGWGIAWSPASACGCGSGRRRVAVNDLARANDTMLLVIPIVPTSSAESAPPVPAASITAAYAIVVAAVWRTGRPAAWSAPGRGLFEMRPAGGWRADPGMAMGLNGSHYQAPTREADPLDGCGDRTRADPRILNLVMVVLGCVIEIFGDHPLLYRSSCWLLMLSARIPCICVIMSASSLKSAT